MTNIKTAYDAFWFIHNHPAGWEIWQDSNKNKYIVQQCGRMNFDISPNKVNPKTKIVDKDKKKNTKVEWWVENGYSILKDSRYLKDDEVLVSELCHDVKLDCGGDSYDEALINSAKLIRKNYGDYEFKDQILKLTKNKKTIKISFKNKDKQSIKDSKNKTIFSFYTPKKVSYEEWAKKVFWLKK